MRITHLTLGVTAVVAGWVGTATIDGAVAGAPGAPLARAASAAGPARGAPALFLAPVPVYAPPADPDLLGTFRMTRYYVAEEPRRAAAGGDAAEVAHAAAAPGGATIYDDRGCRPIASVSPRFRALLDVQGTGRLRDGRVVNVSKACGCGHSPCYRTVPGGARWGLAATSRPLEPFRTVAVDPRVIPLGTTLYLPELDGRTMPGQPPWGGFVHDGCVVATDVGQGIEGRHLDFFVGRHAHKRALDARGKLRRVTVRRGDGRCGADRPAGERPAAARRGAGT